MTKREKYEIGDYICITKDTVTGDYFIVKGSEHRVFSDCKLIHKKDKDVLDAYLADNNVEIEFKAREDLDYIDIPSERNFISYYSDLCYYQLKPQSGQEYKEEVLSKIHEEDDFAKLGFEEPDFECEIFAQKDVYFYGIVLELGVWIQCRWDKQGRSSIWGRFNLTPIKKPWYEDESNFPCLLVLTGGTLSLEHYPMNAGTKTMIEASYARLATNEEIDSLKGNQWKI